MASPDSVRASSNSKGQDIYRRVEEVDWEDSDLDLPAGHQNAIDSVKRTVESRFSVFDGETDQTTRDTEGTLMEEQTIGTDSDGEMDDRLKAAIASTKAAQADQPAVAIASTGIAIDEDVDMDSEEKVQDMNAVRAEPIAPAAASDIGSPDFNVGSDGPVQGPLTVAQYEKDLAIAFDRILREDSHGEHGQSKSGKIPGDEINREKPCFRFHPATTKFTAIWSLTADFSNHVGSLAANGGDQAESAYLRVDNGKNTAIPSINIELDWNKNTPMETKQAERVKQRPDFARHYGLKFEWQPGIFTTAVSEASMDSTTPTAEESGYEVQEFVVVPASYFLTVGDEDEEAAQLQQAVRALVPEDRMPRALVFRLQNFGGRCDQIFDQLDFALLSRGTRSMVDKTKAALTPIYHYVIGYTTNKQVDDDWMTRTTFLWENLFIEKHFKPMGNFLDANVEVVIDLQDDSEYAHTTCNNQYSLYGKNDEITMREQYWASREETRPPPIIFPAVAEHVHKLPFTFHHSVPRVFESIMKLGIKCDHQYKSSQSEPFFSEQHSIIGVHSLDWTQLAQVTDMSRETASKAEKGSVIHSYALFFVYLNSATKREMTELPTQGTYFKVMTPDRLGDPWKAGSQYVGTVHETKRTAAMGADFCLFVKAPRRGKVTLYENDAEARKKICRKTKVVLTPKFDLVTEQRQFDALEKVCDTNNKDMRPLQYILFWQPEVKAPPPVDFRYGNEADRASRLQILNDWETVKETIIRGQGYAENQVHYDVLEYLGQLQGLFTLLLGPAGTAKTSLTCNMHVLGLIADYKILVTGEQHNAVDNDAIEFDKIIRIVKNNLAHRPDLVQKLERKKILRFEARGLPKSVETLRMFAEEHEDLYSNKATPKETAIKDAAMSKWIDLCRDLDRQLEQDYNADAVEKREALKSFICSGFETYQATDVMRKAPAIKCPYSMTMMAHLRRQRDEDVEAGRPRDSELWFELQTKREAGDALTEEEAQEFRRAELWQIIRVVRAADIIFTTISASADPLIMDNTKFDLAYLEEATQINVASACVAFQHTAKHYFIVGDAKQSVAQKSSGRANPALRYLEKSILHWLVAKGVPSFSSRVQYRLFPELCEYLAPNFYPDGMNPADRTKNAEAERHPDRVAFRANSLSEGLIDQKNKRGFNFVMWDVPNGISVKESNGWSRVNDAEACVVKYQAIQLVEKHGANPAGILIVSPYKGQLRRIRELFGEDGNHPWYHDMAMMTADQSQGVTFRIVIFTFVATAVHEINQLFKGTPFEDEVQYVLSKFATNPARLLVGLSRPDHAVGVVCNALTLARIHQMQVSKAQKKPKKKAGDDQEGGQEEWDKEFPESKSGSVHQSLVAFHLARGSYKALTQDDLNPRFDDLPDRIKRAIKDTQGKHEPKTRLNWVQMHKKEIRLRRVKELERLRFDAKAGRTTYNSTASSLTQSAPNSLTQESRLRQKFGVEWLRRGAKRNNAKKNASTGVKRGNEEEPKQDEGGPVSKRNK